MAAKKISELEAKTSLSGAEELLINDGGTSRKITAQTFIDGVGAGGGLVNIVEDTTPQLGGTLDANGNIIDMGTNNITDTKVGQWDIAYGWGDHSTEGYLTSYTETDPVVGAVTGIVKADGAGNISAAIAGTDYVATETYSSASDLLTAIKTVDGTGSGLDADTLDGNEATAFYLASNPAGYTTNTGTVTSVAATVPTGLVVSGSPITSSGTLAISFDTGYAIPTTASQTNWNTAYGWGDHASAGYLTSYTETDPVVGAITGIVKADGAGNISAAIAGTDYLASETYTGTVTSVDLTAGTGISVSGGPVTSSGSITVTNTAPDQTVVLTGGTGITTSGTYPNFTIDADNNGTVTSVGGTGTVNGLTLTGTVTTSGNLTLGGTLAVQAGDIDSQTATDGYVLTADGAGNAAWEAAAAGYTDSDVDTHLNTSTASSGEVLSWNGSDYDWIAAGGGSALELYAENPSSPTSPSATGANAIAIGTNAQATNTNAVALTRNAVASGISSFAVGNNAAATGTNGVAIGTGTGAVERATAIGGAGAQALQQNTTAIGSNSSSQPSTCPAVGGAGAMALGGSRASGTDSFAAAIANNTSSYGATGANSVAMGYQAKATGAYGFALDYQSQATGLASRAIGYQAISSGTNSMALGRNANATGSYSYALAWSKSATNGKLTYGSGQFSSVGDAQQGTFVLRVATTDATPKVLITDTAGAGTTANQIILPNNSAYAFHGTIVARQQASAGTACAAWKIEGLIRREGSAGTTVLVNSATTVLDNTPGWGMALSADTTNGGLKIEVTGAAATNIRWVATVHTSEVTY
jgi:hypothetical protein